MISSSENKKMIPFQSWLSQIIGYCRFVIDEVSMRRAWVDRNYSQTSVTSFDELYEQIFDDLDSDVCEEELIVNLPENAAGRDSISAFLAALRAVNQFIEGNQNRLRPEVLLRTSEWSRVVRAAEQVIVLLGSNNMQA